MNVVGKSMGILASHDMHHTGSNIDWTASAAIHTANDASDVAVTSP